MAADGAAGLGLRRRATVFSAAGGASSRRQRPARRGGAADDLGGRIGQPVPRCADRRGGAGGLSGDGGFQRGGSGGVRALRSDRRGRQEMEHRGGISAPGAGPQEPDRADGRTDDPDRGRGRAGGCGRLSAGQDCGTGPCRGRDPAVRGRGAIAANPATVGNRRSRGTGGGGGEDGACVARGGREPAGSPGCRAELADEGTGDGLFDVEGREEADGGAELSAARQGHRAATVPGGGGVPEIA